MATASLYLPDRDGRIYDVRFTVQSEARPPAQPASFEVVATATAGQAAEHRSRWVIPSAIDKYLDEAKLNRDRLIDWFPSDRQLRREGYLNGVVRLYLRRFPAVLNNIGDDSTFVLDRETVRGLFGSTSGLTALERVARYIEDLLIQLRPLLDGSPLDDSGFLWSDPWRGGAQIVLDRRAKDGDKRAEELYPQLDQLFRDLGQLRGDLTDSDDDITRVLIRGHHLLLEILAPGESPSRASRQKRRIDETHPDWPSQQQVHIRSIELKNIRCFEHLQLELEPKARDRGQWITLLGDNGAGKTTILRALALALLPPNVANALVTRSESSMVQLAKPYGQITVALDNVDEPARVSIETSRSNGDTLTSSTSLRPPVFAYGCRRGSALGGPDRAVNTDMKFGADTLFFEDARLIHALTWLSQIDAAGRRGDERKRELFDTMREHLKKLLYGVKDIHFRGDQLQVSGDTVGSEIPFESLSDGYLTTVGWVVDFLARISEYAHSTGAGSPGHDMPCVVLIDELDLHLHPKWQIDVIRRVRDAFPNATFVATTHNPLTLHHAEPGQVYVLDRGSDGEARVVQRDLPPGIDASGLLTGDWFGLDTTLLDRQALRWLSEHRALLVRGAKPDDPRLLGLEDALRRRLGGYADTSLERVAQSMVADYLEKHHGTINDGDRAELQTMFERAMADRDGDEESGP